MRSQSIATRPQLHVDHPRTLCLLLANDIVRLLWVPHTRQRDYKWQIMLRTRPLQPSQEPPIERDTTSHWTTKAPCLRSPERAMDLNMDMIIRQVRLLKRERTTERWFRCGSWPSRWCLSRSIDQSWQQEVIHSQVATAERHRVRRRGESWRDTSVHLRKTRESYHRAGSICTATVDVL